MNNEYWIPEDIWNIVKSYLLYKEFYIGDVIYGLPKKYSNFINYSHFASDKCGIVVDKTGKYKDATYYVSIPEYGGDYLVLSHDGLYLFKKKMNSIEKLIMIAKFGYWWYPLHKTVFQEIIITSLI
tara:strand:- start:217 stop:594 length:378 start_codon:yes stop_codon:yes gene_type:complete